MRGQIRDTLDSYFTCLRPLISGGRDATPIEMVAVRDLLLLSDRVPPIQCTGLTRDTLLAIPTDLDIIITAWLRTFPLPCTLRQWQVIRENIRK